MRIMFTFAGGSGHLEPLVPLARAAADVGHVVAFVGRPWMVPKVEGLGFTAFAAGSDAGLIPQRLPLAEVDIDREIRAMGVGFGRRIARERAADMLPLCAAWQPDIVVCEEVDFGAMVVAERLGLPHATVLVIAAGGQVRPAVVAGPLNEVRAEHGLVSDDDLAMPSRHLVLSPFPPTYRDPAFPLPATAHAFRLSPPGPVSASAMQPWLASRSSQPTVYFTLGTVFNNECGDLFSRVITGLRDLPINLFVTVGRDIDPTELGLQPANVQIAQYIPQKELLPYCSLVVSHGGSGSVMGALAYGLPLVVIPMGGDQPLNAARCEALGLGRVLDAVRCTSNDARDAVSAVLEDSRFRHAAMGLRDEIDALPGTDYALTLLEELACL